MIPAKPFVRMIGGKTQLLPEIRKLIPGDFDTYCEPMLGGGAVFFDLASRGLLQGKHVLLGDNNADIVLAFSRVRDHVETLIKQLLVMRMSYMRGPAHAEKLYYRVRKAWNDGDKSAASFIFLKQTSFNGLWRYNREGKLNMAWGKLKNPNIVDPNNLRACSAALQKVTIAEVDVLHPTTFFVGRGRALFYVDPPYAGTFNQYSAEGFSQQDHVTLIKHCRSAQAYGGHVIYSNSLAASEWVAEYWPKADVREVDARAMVNRDGGGRHKKPELLVYGKALGVKKSVVKKARSRVY